MRFMLIVFILVGCTKKNPGACCTDEANCAAVGLPSGSTCDEGKLCRGNRCVEQRCTTVGDCDATAPYCVKFDDSVCSETCSTDSNCPGFGQTDADKFCVGGGCVQCRAGISDCPAEAPLCTADGKCAACIAHADCASGVCDNGRCAREDEIAYVATNGNPASDCTPVSPCNTIDRGLLVGPARQFVLIESGTYSSTSAIAIIGVRWLIGRGASRPVLTRSTDGPIVVASGPSQVKLQHLEVFGARGTSSPNQGNGVECNAIGGAPKLELIDMLVRLSASDGVNGSGCDFNATASQFLNNTNHGVRLTDGTALIDRCTSMFSSIGVALDGGIYVVTNTVVARNSFRGIDLYSVNNGNRIEHSTIIDNGDGAIGSGIECNLVGNAVGVFPNNIIARNKPLQVEPTTNSQCIYPGSMLIDTDITALKLKMPDAPPYDFHLLPGSNAIDVGVQSSIKTDLDGESRPFGGANDVGADELH